VARTVGRLVDGPATTADVTVSPGFALEPLQPEDRALVYTTLIPQFVDRGGSEIAQTFVLAGVFIAMGLVWLTGYALLVARIGALLRRSSVRRAVAGTILTPLGVRLAFERR
jgi:threonine/homoserine/homoserine lactone efflux protein